MSEDKCFCVVRIDDDGNDDVCIITSLWLTCDERCAHIPNIIGVRFNKTVESHRIVYETDPLREITVIAKRTNYNEAVEVQRTYELGKLPSSSDLTIIKRPQTSTKEDKKAVQKCLIREAKPKYAPFTPSAHTQTAVCAQHIPSASNVRDEPSTPRNAASDGRFDTMFETTYDRVALQYLTKLVMEMNERQKSMERMIAILDRKMSMCMSKDCPPSPFPITSLDTFVHVDGRLDASDVKEHLSAVLRTTDGANTSKLVRNIMQRLLSRNFAAEINYSGAHGKYAFKKHL